MGFLNKDRDRARGRELAESVDSVPDASSADEIAAFMEKAKTIGGSGRLAFAMDATMSRQPTWDRAVHLQSGMFDAVASVGTLDVQLIYFRGFGECRASRWVADAKALRSLMERIDCRGGHTQIGKVLAHARRETGRQKLSALVLVGDACEESIDDLAAKAGELGLLGVPCFTFQEGRDRTAERAFREIARLTDGAYARFDSGSADRLGELLRAVAAFSAGGLRALESQGAEGRKLLEQLSR